MTGVDPEQLERARAYLAERVAAGELAGAVAMVACGGRVIARWAVGHAQLVPDSLAPRPMSEDTLFDLASVTKPIAATALLVLLDRDGASSRVRLDDPIARVLPEYAHEGTVRDVLTHTTGLPA